MKTKTSAALLLAVCLIAPLQAGAESPIDKVLRLARASDAQYAAGQATTDLGQRGEFRVNEFAYGLAACDAMKAALYALKMVPGAIARERATCAETRAAVGELTPEAQAVIKRRAMDFSRSTVN